jgi:short-subunit dehydrogenase
MMNGKDAVLSFINSLEAETRKDAYTVLNMMVAAVMDEITDIDDLTKLELDRIRNL